MTKTNTQVPPGMDLVKWEPCDRPIPEFLTVLPWAADDDAIVLEIAARIMAAQSVDEVLRRQEAVDIDDLLNVPVRIYGFRMTKSDLDEGIGAYAVIDYTYADNDKHQVTTTSALGVLAQLARIHQLGGFPFDCALTEIETSKKGRNNPKYLAPAPKEEPF